MMYHDNTRTVLIELWPSQVGFIVSLLNQYIMTESDPKQREFAEDIVNELESED